MVIEQLGFIALSGNYQWGRVGVLSTFPCSANLVPQTAGPLQLSLISTVTILNRNLLQNYQHAKYRHKGKIT